MPDVELGAKRPEFVDDANGSLGGVDEIGSVKGSKLDVVLFCVEVEAAGF